MKDRKQIIKIAKSMFNSALKANTLNKTGESLRYMSGLLQKNPDILNFFKDVFQPEDRLVEVLQNIGENFKFDKLSATYFSILLEQRQIDLIPMIFDYYQHLADAHLGQDRAVVSTPFVLGREDKQKLIDSLSAATGKKIFLRENIDKSLIAGISVKIGSMIYDGSLSNQLRRIEKEISNAS